MSALPPKADIRPRDQDVCFGPISDVLQRRKIASLLRRQTTVKSVTDLPIGAWCRFGDCSRHDPVRDRKTSDTISPDIGPPSVDYCSLGQSFGSRDEQRSNLDAISTRRPATERPRPCAILSVTHKGRIKEERERIAFPATRVAHAMRGRTIVPSRDVRPMRERWLTY
jgi:hypothetical protein